MPSSTSSSDPGRGVPRVGIPWALLGAVLAVGLVEIGVRVVEPRALLPYDSGENEYFAAARHIEVYGAAEISVVGSSRTKEGIHVPELASRLGAEVRNYACAGARADEIRALVDHLLRHGTPDLVLCGVSPRVFLDADRRWARSAIFWEIKDWRRAAEADLPEALAVLPVMTRNVVGDFWRTLDYRQKPAVLADDAVIFCKSPGRFRALTLGDFLAGGVRPSPLNGGLTGRQRDVGSRSLVTHPVSEERVQAYVDQLLTNGEYVMGEVRFEALVAMAEACKDHGVRLVFFEEPVSAILHRHRPPDVYPRFLERMRSVARVSGAEFLPIDSLGVHFGDPDFAEQSHLNLPGARKLSVALAETLQRRAPR